jgi:hypothetical protein
MNKRLRRMHIRRLKGESDAQEYLYHPGFFGCFSLRPLLL